ncbi:DUF2950 domain-containing protein [Ensifer sp. PDNC004]|uniref:DUF2950 domain-containing protein n=1 Tax=unclassified Ensifer TaxID=2633371 RepID=UPI0017857B35|nr:MULTISPECIES: DUF2950 domain-containing protein [unclassified Ensifer]MBD9649240.1 DUF2950 domain-containing protein [Ensifer sp. ENS09]QRY66648.1 DUF2950 domain-containing protein [Ensifer sp. PDNC004]
MTKRVHHLLLSSIAAAVLVSGSATFASAQDAAAHTPLSDYAAASDPPVFDTPEQAIDAFKSAVASGDFDKLANLVGLDAAKAKTSDGVMDAYADIQAGVKKKVAVQDVENRKVLEIGEVLWPFPFPIAKGKDGKWAFDTYVGLEEIANRLVGRNELDTIATVRAYVEAQEEYALEDHDGDGVLEYAQKLISSEGKTDGLYWPAGEGEPQSPAGEALADGAVLAKAQAGKGYFGYRYRVLTSQGDNIAGGKFDYIINGNMIAGFALVAWPVRYGATGVHTFVVNRNGTVYQADLGDKTESVANGIRQFNPNDNWQVVED